MKREFSFQSMADRWPSPIVAREQIHQFTGGIYNPKYMANLDSQGLGPDERIRIKRKVAYPVDSVVRWLEGRAERIK